MQNDSEHIDFYNSTYGKFTDRVLAEIRNETFGKDIGQNSWITVDEMGRLLKWLSLNQESNLLEIACGSGGPALFIAETIGCNICAVDNNEHGIKAARESVLSKNLQGKARFEVADANQKMPFEGEMFDAIVCMDAINHFANRPMILGEWHRLLKRGGRFLYTDPIVVTGPLTNEEIAIRSSIGFFLFVPNESNEKWIEESGFKLLQYEDVTSDAAMVAKRWHDARAKRKKELESFEGAKRFQGLQYFFEVVYRLYSEQRLSRIAYIGEKP